MEHIKMKIPNFLYHITKAESAIQILQEGALNASGVVRCNDPFELDHPPALIDLSKAGRMNYFSERIVDLINQRNQTVLKTFRKETLKYLDSLDKAKKYFF